MKTEKGQAIRTWWIDIFSYNEKEPMIECNCYHIKPKHWPKKPLENMQLEVIRKDDHLAIMRQLQEEASAKIATLETRITKLRETLEFYADEKNWQEDELGSPYNSYIAMTDGGNKARQALVEIEDETLAEDASTKVSAKVNSTKVSSGDGE